MSKTRAIRTFHRWMARVGPSMDLAETLDAGFDGGEFSGPAHDASNDARIEAMLTRLQLTYVDVYPA